MSGRPTILELYGIDARDFIGMPHEVVTQKKIDAIVIKQKSLTKELTELYNDSNAGYEDVAGINGTLKYLGKTYDGLMADMAEMTAKREENENITEECLIFKFAKNLFKGRE